MQRIPGAPPIRGSPSNANAPAKKRAAGRSPRKHTTPTVSSRSPRRSPRRSSNPKGDAGVNSRLPTRVGKSPAQMREEISQLESILADRRHFYQDLLDEDDRLRRVLGSEADDLLNSTPTDAAKGDEEKLQATRHMSEDEEIRYLSQRNANLLRELKNSMEAERRYGNDPKVMDKRNEVNLVKMQIKQVEREIETLQTVKKRRDGALKEIDRSEQVARRVRGQQREITDELRSELKSLMEQLRVVEKDDFETHERHARLQEQVKLGVTGKDVEDLKRTVVRQEEEIKELTVSETTWKVRKAGARDESQRLLAKEQKECIRLEKEVDRLRAHLIQKDAELRKSYQLVGRANSGLADPSTRPSPSSHASGSRQ